MAILTGAEDILGSDVSKITPEMLDSLVDMNGNAEMQFAPPPATTDTNNTGTALGTDTGTGTVPTDTGTGDTEPYDQPAYYNPADNLEDITVKEGSTYLTPEATVGSRLEALMDKGSTIQQQAGVRAKEQASALGMMSSSSAIGAQRRADVEALMPAALKDAEIGSQFQLKQQEAENAIAQIQIEGEVSGSLTQQKAEIAEQSKKIDQDFQTLMKTMDNEQQTFLTNLKGEWETSLKELEADVTRELQQQEIDASVEATIMNQAHDMMNNYQITVQQLLSSESFLDSMPDQESMKDVFNDMFQTVQSSIRFSAKAAGIYDSDMVDYVNYLRDANQW